MIQIRNYTEADAKATWDLFFHTVHNVNIRDYTPEQVAVWAADSISDAIWKEKMTAIQPFIAELDGVMVGYSDLQADGLVDHFFCHEAYQGRGVGRALMQHIFAQAKQRNIPRLYSNVSITAKPFYAHFGFSVVKQQTHSIRGQVLVNYLMEKFL